MIDLQTESFAPLDECSMQIKRALSVLATVTQSRSMKLPSYVDKIGSATFENRRGCFEWTVVGPSLFTDNCSIFMSASASTFDGACSEYLRHVEKTAAKYGLPRSRSRLPVLTGSRVDELKPAFERSVDTLNEATNKRWPGSTARSYLWFRPSTDNETPDKWSVSVSGIRCFEMDRDVWASNPDLYAAAMDAIAQVDRLPLPYPCNTTDQFAGLPALQVAPLALPKGRSRIPNSGRFE